MMNRIVVLIVLSLFPASIGWATAGAQVPPLPPEELPAGAEVLNRGPVNEAFAEPATMQDQPGLVVSKQPPPNIEEIPPADRPAGDHYVWIPGYWSWDADRNDFVWVGACWRIAPPKMSWVPGYWAAVSSGWEWVPGFWAPAGTRRIDYLPAPPPPEELAAPGTPPEADDVWVPGCWYWVRDKYVFRPGYWLAGRDSWVWMPSHYVWSPRGFIFVAGYWDLALDERGVVFAPIYFPLSVYGNPGFSFSPEVVLDLDAIGGSFFVYPSYCHYFFGDYYDDVYLTMGIYPQFDCDRLHTWYDPLFEYQRWRYRRTDPRWVDHQHEAFDRIRRDRDARPPRIFRDAETRAAGMPEGQRRSVELVRPLRAVVTGGAARVRFEQIGPDARWKLARSGTDVHGFRATRRGWEAPANPSPATTPADQARHQVPATRAERVKVPAAPVSARQRGTSRNTAPVAPPPRPSDERAQEKRRTRR